MSPEETGGMSLMKNSGKPFGGDPVHGAQDGPVPVGIGQVFVDPGARGQSPVGELPGGEHDLAVFAVDLVAVVVHVDELVIGADLLELAVGG